MRPGAAGAPRKSQRKAGPASKHDALDTDTENDGDVVFAIASVEVVSHLALTQEFRL